MMDGTREGLLSHTPAQEGGMTQHETPRERPKKGGVEGESARAAYDLARYAQALPQIDGYVMCGAIERRWSLYGYPPEIVCDVLGRVADGVSLDDAEAAVLAIPQEHEDEQ